MTLDEARALIIDGIDYAAYKETGSSLHDSDKNRLFGSEHYRSGRAVTKPSPWAESDFEEKMTMLLAWATTLNFSDPAFGEAKTLLEREDSVLGRVIRLPDQRGQRAGRKIVISLTTLWACLRTRGRRAISAPQSRRKQQTG